MDGISYKKWMDRIGRVLVSVMELMTGTVTTNHKLTFLTCMPRLYRPPLLKS